MGLPQEFCALLQRSQSFAGTRKKARLTRHMRQQNGSVLHSSCHRANAVKGGAVGYEPKAGDSTIRGLDADHPTEVSRLSNAPTCQAAAFVRLL